MKRICMAVMALVFNSLLLSCTPDSLVETDELIHLQATEGDDGNTPPPPPGGSN
jgi:hypothetical protein